MWPYLFKQTKSLKYNQIGCKFCNKNNECQKLCDNISYLNIKDKSLYSLKMFKHTLNQTSIELHLLKEEMKKAGFNYPNITDHRFCPINNSTTFTNYYLKRINTLIKQLYQHTYIN